MKRLTHGVIFFVCIAALLFFIKPLYAHEEEERYKIEIRYSTHIAPIVKDRCLVCHGARSPEHGVFSVNKAKYKDMSLGPRIDNYSLMIGFIGWPDTGAIMRRLDDGKNTKDGKPGNMYVFLGATEEERQKNLAVFKDWIGYWTLKRWNKVTKEELEKIRAKY